MFVIAGASGKSGSVVADTLLSQGKPVRVIVRDAPAHLMAGRWLLLEHGLEQGPAVRDLLQAAGFDAVATEPDLEGRDRVTLGRMPG
jgi:release factor glutamine methyltransferase